MQPWGKCEQPHELTQLLPISVLPFLLKQWLFYRGDRAVSLGWTPENLSRKIRTQFHAIPQNQQSAFGDTIALVGIVCPSLPPASAWIWGRPPLSLSWRNLSMHVSLLPLAVTKHDWWGRLQIHSSAKGSNFWRSHCFPSSSKTQSNGSSYASRHCWLPTWIYKRLTEHLEMIYETISSPRKCHGLVWTLPSGEVSGHSQLTHLDGGCWVLATLHYQQGEDLGTKHSSRQVAMSLHLPKYKLGVQ